MVHFAPRLRCYLKMAADIVSHQVKSALKRKNSIKPLPEEERKKKLPKGKEKTTKKFEFGNLDKLRESEQLLQVTQPDATQDVCRMAAEDSKREELKELLASVALEEDPLVKVKRYEAAIRGCIPHAPKSARVAPYAA